MDSALDEAREVDIDNVLVAYMHLQVSVDLLSLNARPFGISELRRILFSTNNHDRQPLLSMDSGLVGEQGKGMLMYDTLVEKENE